MAPAAAAAANSRDKTVHGGDQSASSSKQTIGEFYSTSSVRGSPTHDRSTCDLLMSQQQLNTETGCEPADQVICSSTDGDQPVSDRPTFYDEPSLSLTPDLTTTPAPPGDDETSVHSPDAARSHCACCPTVDRPFQFSTRTYSTDFRFRSPVTDWTPSVPVSRTLDFNPPPLASSAPPRAPTTSAPTTTAAAPSRTVERRHWARLQNNQFRVAVALNGFSWPTGPHHLSSTLCPSSSPSPAKHSRDLTNELFISGHKSEIKSSRDMVT